MNFIKRLKWPSGNTLLLLFIVGFLGGVKMCQLKTDLVNTKEFKDISFEVLSIEHYTYQGDKNKRPCVTGRGRTSCAELPHFKIKVSNEKFKEPLFLKISESNYYENKDKVKKGQEINIDYSEFLLNNEEHHYCVTKVINKELGSYYINFHTYNDSVKSFSHCENPLMTKKQLESKGKRIWSSHKIMNYPKDKKEDLFEVKTVQ